CGRALLRSFFQAAARGRLRLEPISVKHIPGWNDLSNAELGQAAFDGHEDVLVQEAGAGHASHVRVHVVGDLFRQVPQKNDVADGELSTRLENAADFAEDSGFIGAQIDHAIADDKID